MYRNEGKCLISIWLIIAAIIILALCTAQAVHKGKWFKTVEPVEKTSTRKFKTEVIKTICGPCLAFTSDQYRACGERIGRYQIVWADGKCRYDEYLYNNKDKSEYES